METLEQQIRNALIEEKRDALYEKFSSDDYKHKLEVVMYNVMDTMINEICEIAGEEKPISGMEKGMIKMMMQVQLSQSLSNSNLKKMAYSNAQMLYLTKPELIERIDGMVSQLESMPGTNPEAIQRFRDMNNELFESYDGNDYYVSKLVEIAEKEGIEHALSQETRYEIIRERFPTAQMYIENCISSINRATEYLDDMIPVMEMDGEAGRLSAFLIKSIKESAKEMDLVNFETQKEAIYEEAVKIYGN